MERFEIMCQPGNLRSALFLLALGLFTAAEAAAAGGTELLREYFVRQGAEETLVIRIDPFEAEFTAWVSDDQAQVLWQSGLPGNRNQPVFAYIDPAGKDRQLDIDIEATWSTTSTRFDLEYSRLDIRDELSGRLAQAYRMLAQGQEALTQETAANWSVRVGLLLRAARDFEALGREELRLWALLAGAHLAHFRLGDTQAAVDLVTEGVRGAQLAGLGRLELSARMLLGQVLLSQPGTEDVGQAELAAASELAVRLGEVYEAAFAGYLKGLGSAEADDDITALRRFDDALELALGRGALDLAAQVRKRMAETHDRLGDLLAREQVLGSMIDQLGDRGAHEDLVRSLLQQAALLMELRRYPSAEALLIRVLEVDDVSLTRTQATIMLGQCLYQSGRFSEALEILTGSLVSPETGQFRRPSPLLPLGPGLASLAGTYRTLGDAAQTQRVRRVQGRHLESAGERAEWYLQRILDSLAFGDPNGAWAAWREAGPSWQGAGTASRRDLALLALCVEAPAGAGDRCSEPDLAAALGRVSSLPEPRERLEGLYRGLQGIVGRSAADADRALSLLEDIHFHRAELPGVLGAWFWENRDRVFRLALQRVANRGPAATLLALSRIRAIGQVSEPAETGDELRAALAGSQPALAGLLAGARGRFEQRNWWLSQPAMERSLGSLPEGEAVLAAVVEGTTVRAWVGTRRGVESLSWRLSEDVAEALKARSGPVWIRGVDEVMAPALGHLPARVYWLGTGLLLGLDLSELLPAGGAIPEVVSLARFPVLPDRHGLQGRPLPGRVFVAGDPRDWSSEFPDRLDATAEIRTVMDQFVGPGLHVVQGGALLRDEFDDPRLGQAELVHFSSPAFIDLAQPDRSGVSLSEPGRRAGRERLAPSDLAALPLEGALVVLSQPGWRGSPDDAYASHVALVDELLDAGAAGVIVPSRALGDEAAADFARRLYGGWRKDGFQAAWAAARAAAPVPLQLFQSGRAEMR